jgi:multicomponent Na+:H+ antiporter subunit D
VSKWYILSGAMATQQWGAVAVLVAGTLLSAGYLLSIVYRAFFLSPAPSHGHHEEHGEAPLTMVIAVSVSALGTVALFFFPEALLALSRQLAGVG